MSDGFDAVDDDIAFVSYEASVEMLLQALRSYLPWIHDVAFGEYDPETGKCYVEPNVEARKEYDFLEHLCTELEELQKLPADMAQRMHPAPRARQ